MAFGCRTKKENIEKKLRRQMKQNSRAFWLCKTSRTRSALHLPSVATPACYVNRVMNRLVWAISKAISQNYQTLFIVVWQIVIILQYYWFYNVVMTIYFILLFPVTPTALL